MIEVYRLDDIKNPTQERIIEMEGYMTEARLTNKGKLIAVTKSGYDAPIILSDSWASRDGQAENATGDMTGSGVIPKVSSRLVRSGKKLSEQISSPKDCSQIASILPEKSVRKTLSFSPSIVQILQVNLADSDAPPTVNRVFADMKQIYVSYDSVYLIGEMFRTFPSRGLCFGIWGDCRPAQYKANTVVHRFTLQNTGAEYAYSVALSGSPLSEYSMHENDKQEFALVTQDFRTGEERNQSHTQLHIFAKDGKLLGAIRGIAPGESFQSSRFIGDRLYLVTFEQIDPFFVIDISEPTAPKILGELKIPGYSRYLHPYDAHRLIGIGYDTITNEYGTIRNGGIKIDLYNVSDVHHPVQEQSLVLGGAGSRTNVFSDPRAFTYYKEKQLLLLIANLTAPLEKRHTFAFQGEQ